MKKEEVNLIYVDDMLDRDISKCLNKHKHDKVVINYSEINFDSSYDYKKLIEEMKVQKVNLIVIDSALYIESDKRERFTGEQFKIILKNILPYAETIVISQNKQENNYGIIKKYNRDEVEEDKKEYYEKSLSPVVNKKIEEILMGREMINLLEDEKIIDNSLIEKISLSVNGESQYSELKTEDINLLIKSFQELKESIDG
ncbi:MAG: hypothetical protein RSB50_05295 [Cetobacterium sp.]